MTQIETRPICFENRLASLIYKLVLVVVCLVGIILNMGLANGTFAPYVFLYYTIASSIMCLIFFSVNAVVVGLNIRNTGSRGVIRFVPHFKGGVVMAMLLNVMVYFLVLSDSPFTSANLGAAISSIVVHIVVPLMVVADWILFDRKGRFFPSDPVIWLVVPFLYYAIVLVAAQLGVKYYGNTSYPYYFLDPERIRWIKVLVNIFIITGSYLLASYALLGIDRLIWYIPNRKALRGEVQPQATAPGDAAGPESTAEGEQPAAPFVPQAPPVEEPKAQIPTGTPYAPPVPVETPAAPPNPPAAEPPA